MNREQFLEYMDHFNNHRWDKVTSYFCPDVTLEYPDSFGNPGSPDRTLYGPQEMVKLVKAVTGWNVSIDEMLEVGERRLVMMRMFNRREGFDAADDSLPAKFFDQPLKGGVSDGVAVDKAEFAEALVEYYRQSGWNETTGHPTAETIGRLGLSML